MHCERHDAGRFRAFLVDSVKVVDRAGFEDRGVLVLDQRDYNVVSPEVVGQGDEIAMLGLQWNGLVVECPVADIFEPGFGQMVKRFERFSQARSEPSARPVTGDLLDRRDCLSDVFTLILDLVHRDLFVGMGIVFPANLDRGLDHKGIGLAGAAVHGDGAFVPRSENSLRSRQNTIRMPYECHDQLGTSGSIC